jgi:hypothetical protein
LDGQNIQDEEDYGCGDGGEDPLCACFGEKKPGVSLVTVGFADF